MSQSLRREDEKDNIELRTNVTFMSGLTFKMLRTKESSSPQTDRESVSSSLPLSFVRIENRGFSRAADLDFRRASRKSDLIQPLLYYADFPY